MFIPLALVTADNTYILLKFIESIGEPPANSELLLIDKLKSDIRISVRTISGKDYVISIRHQMSTFVSHNPPSDEFEYRDSIIKRWIEIGNPP